MKRKDTSFLPNETAAMELKRREIEKRGEKKLAAVIEVEHVVSELAEFSASSENSADMSENGLLGHPLLSTLQRFDGADPDLNANPPQAGTEARRKFDIEQENQKDAKEYRLGLANMPKFNPKPNIP
jgi:hypothetical protein